MKRKKKKSAKKRRRARAQLRKQERCNAVGNCHHVVNTDRGGLVHECLTCERLGHEVYTVRSCAAHAAEGAEKIRKHVLVGHPANLVRATIAQLRGEDVL